jgi:hypothetical protein
VNDDNDDEGGEDGEFRLSPKKKKRRLSKRQAVADEEPEDAGDRPGPSTRRQRAKRSVRVVDQALTGDQPYVPDADDEESDGESDADKPEELEDAGEDLEVPIDRIEEFRRKHRRHLQPRNKFKLPNPPVGQRFKPSAFRIMQVGDFERDESLRGSPEELEQAKAALAADFRHVLERQQQYAARPVDERPVMTNFTANEVLASDVNDDLATIMSAMPDNTKLAMARRDFGRKDLDDMAPVTEIQLCGGVWIVYHGIIEFWDETPDEHYGGSSIVPWQRLYNGYERPLQYADAGYFARMLGGAGFARHASAPHVKAVHIRIVLVLPAPAPTADFKFEVRKLRRFEGVVMDAFGLIRHFPGEMKKCGEKSFDMDAIFEMTTFARPPGRVAPNGVNVMHPLVMGGHMAPGNGPFAMIRAAAHLQEFCAMCKKPFTTVQLSLCVNPFKDRVDVGINGICLCTGCRIWTRRNVERIDACHSREDFDHVGRIWARQLWFREEDMKHDDCILCEKPYDPLPEPRPHVWKTGPGRYRIQLSNTVADKNWICLKDLIVCCVFCNLTLSLLATRDTSSAQMYRKQLDEGADLAGLREIMADRAAQGHNRYQGMPTPLPGQQCVCCGDVLKCAHKGEGIQTSSKRDTSIAQWVTTSLKEVFRCLADVEMLCIRDAQRLSKNRHLPIWLAFADDLAGLAQHIRSTRG